MYLGPNNATDVWSVKKINPNAMVHLTEKPVELAIRAMQYTAPREDGSHADRWTALSLALHAGQKPLTNWKFYPLFP